MSVVVYGTAKSGEVLAIMGSRYVAAAAAARRSRSDGGGTCSGAGKTTLLNVLLNVDQADVRRSAESRVLVNGEAISAAQMRSISAYVQQVDM